MKVLPGWSKTDKARKTTKDDYRNALNKKVKSADIYFLDTHHILQLRVAHC